VHTHANTRFAVQSWKSQNANPENPAYRKNQAKPKDQNQTQLRKTRDSAEKGWTKLAISANAKRLFFLSPKNPSRSR
jgi:hypothetical protein